MNYRILSSIVALLCGILIGIPANASSIQIDWKPVYYDMNIRIDFHSEKLYADCKITIMNNTGKPVQEIPLMLYRLLRVTSVTDENNNELSFQQNVTTFNDFPKLQVNAIQVNVPEKIAPKERYTMRLSYEGYIFGYAEAIGAAYRERIGEPFTILRYESFAYPNPGHPTQQTLFAFIFYSYDYQVKITVPEHLVVANGGRLLNKTVHDGQVSYTYENIKPAWRMDFAIAPYQLREDNGLRIFYLSNTEEEVGRAMSLIKRALNLFTEWFGPLKDFQNFSVIDIPEGYGAQADVTSIFLSSEAFSMQDFNIRLYHELSHLWHPMETEPFPPCRWNEGLATFLQYLAAQELDDRPGLVDRMSKAMQQKFINQCINTPNCLETPFIDYGKTLMWDFSYTKGMVLFHVLYELIGKEAFTNLIGNYYDMYYETGGSTHNLTAMIKQLPHGGVSRFVDEWFYGMESNEYLIEEKSVREIVNMYNERN